MRLLFLLQIIVGFTIKPRLFYRQKLKSIIKSNLLYIQPQKTVAYFRLNDNQLNQISTIINTRYKIEPIFINTNFSYYLGLTLYKYNTTLNNNFIFTCKIFVYVQDIQNKLYGQYILESSEYSDLYIDHKSVLCSFYGYNSNYNCCMSYLRNKLDYSFYNNYNYFDFMIENNIYYLNSKNNTQLNNNIRCSKYIYISQLKYKDMYWDQADQIIYYDNNYVYNQIIDEK